MKKIILFLSFLITIVVLAPSIVLADEPPTVAGVYIYGERKTNTDLTIEVIARDDVGVKTIHIDFGDGASSSKAAERIVDPDGIIYKSFFHHQYISAGDYKLVAYAVDSTGQESDRDYMFAYTRVYIAGADDLLPTISILSAPNTADPGDSIEITVTGGDDRAINSLHGVWGDGTDLFCACSGDYKPCDNQGKTTCSNRFTHRYSVENYYDIQVWSKDENDQWSEIKKHRIKIGDPSKVTIGPIDLPNPLECDSFQCFIDKIISFLFTIALILAPILLIIAGIMFMTSGGDPEKARKAKRLILYTLIGFAIIALSRLFLELLKQLFKIKEIKQ